MLNRAKNLAKVSSSSVSKSPAGSSNTKKTPAEWRQRIQPQHYELLRQTFLIFDQDGSGIIDPSEISKALEELGLDKRNPYVLNIVTALRETNKKLTFEEFVGVVCSYTGEFRTKDGIRRVFNLYDKEQTGVIEFEQLKHIARSLGEYLTDDELLDLMHAVFIKHQTTSNESISFEEFYAVISAYYSRKDLPKAV